MAASTGNQVVIEVESVDQIFNAPDVDPFSKSESIILGEAALERILTQLQVHPLQSWDGAQLVVRLPETAITPSLDLRLGEAIRRYCAARIEDNHLKIRLSRRQHMVGMIAVTTTVLIVIVGAYLLFTTVLAGVSTDIMTLVAASISVFAWVILWDPLEALLFDWAPPARENRALAHVMDMRVVVQSRS